MPPGIRFRSLAFLDRPDPRTRTCRSFYRPTVAAEEEIWMM